MAFRRSTVRSRSAPPTRRLRLLGIWLLPPAESSASPSLRRAGSGGLRTLANSWRSLLRLCRRGRGRPGSRRDSRSLLKLENEARRRAQRLDWRCVRCGRDLRDSGFRVVLLGSAAVSASGQEDRRADAEEQKEKPDPPHPWSLQSFDLDCRFRQILSVSSEDYA
jgi:hypothetical protein